MSVASTLDTNKYKLLMKITIEDLDIIKGILVVVIKVKRFIMFGKKSIYFQQKTKMFAK